jgi:hypothetical protein
MLKVFASSTMEYDSMVGLMLAMTALGGIVSLHIARFVGDLEPSTRHHVLGLYEGKLSLLFKDARVCKWIASNVDYVTHDIINLAKYINDNSTPHP